MKRNFDSTVNVDYSVIETIEDDLTYVQFLPQLWLVPVGNSKFVERAHVKFYFPLRMKNQSKDSYFNFVKRAKFICMKPENDGKWEIRQGRILKMGLGTLEEALNAQKLYSDYFSTTEAEMAIVAPEPKRCVRKKKKVASKATVSSDSEDESQETNTVPNFNNQFATPSHNTFDQENVLDVSDFNRLFPDTMFALQDNASLPIQQTASIMSHSDGLSDPSNELFITLNVPSSDRMQSEESGGAADIEIITDDINYQQTDCAKSSCCKGHQKIMNKIDYVHKKFSKQFSLIHQENAANRRLLLRLLEQQTQSTDVTEVNKDNQFEVNDHDATENIQGQPIRLDVVELEEFHAQYKETFPIRSADAMIEFNNTMKLDQKFVNNLFSKLSQIVAEDETKAARKILKELCDFRCLKDFTWQGTKKMKSFERLHLVVTLITGLLKEKYPDCNAMETLIKVVKQRTKSAKEAWTNFLEKKVEQSDTPGQDSVKAASATVSTHSMNTEPKTNGVQSAVDSIGGNMSTTSEAETIPETNASMGVMVKGNDLIWSEMQQSNCSTGQ